MKAIVCLFSKTTSRTDSEKYLYPNIENVKVTIEGVPNSVYNQGLPKNRLRVYYYQTILQRQIYALVIDLQAIEDNSRHGAGKKVINTQIGVLLKIAKLPATVDVKCRIYVLSNGLFNFVNNVQPAEYPILDLTTRYNIWTNLDVR